MLSSTLLIAGAVLLAGQASAHAASDLAVAVVEEQFKSALLVPQIFPEFEPQGTLILNWTTVGISTVGQAIPVGDTAVKPSISIKGTHEAEETLGGPFNDTETLYTVMIVDANVAGNTNTSALYRHYLANDLTYGPNSDHSVLLVNTTPAITEYAGPAPPSGSGPHRYTVLAFAQPANFTPSSLTVPTPISPFDPIAYITGSNLTLIAATYFTVEVGTSTVSVAATSSVVSTTFAEYTATSAAHEGHGDAASTGTSASGSTAPSASPTGAASTLSLTAFGAGIVGFAVWSLA